MYLFRISILFSALVGLMISFSGCASYQAGSPSVTMPFNTLYVETVTNDSFAPQMQAVLTQNLRESLMRDTNLSLKNRSDADATLKVVIREYERDLGATDNNDTALGRSFTLRLIAQATLYNNRTGQPYFADRVFDIEETVYVTTSLSQAEYQALPSISNTLALRIRSAVTSTW